MNIEFIQARSIPGVGNFVAGAKAELDDELGRQLIRQGIATEQPKPKPVKETSPKED